MSLLAINLKAHFRLGGGEHLEKGIKTYNTLHVWVLIPF